IYPASVKLVGSDESCQVIVTGLVNTGRLQDLTGEVKYEVADAKIARVTSTGRVVPLASGGTTIIARYGAKSISVPVIAQAIEENLPINFPNQIVPIFS